MSRSEQGRGRRFAREDEVERRFPNDETGTMPRCGLLYGQRVCVDEALTKEFDVVFKAGTHTEG
jgi:prolyl-tRNA editing enzyme YbaK/EbsC (Cys-tRNA(Pro) deacylase)